MSVANLAILDTSIYIDNLRSGRFKQEILDLKFVVRCSAVVLAELSRGARSPLMRRFVDGLAKNLYVIAPNERRDTIRPVFPSFEYCMEVLRE